MRTTAEDLRAAARGLRSRPAATLLAVATLTLGIGLNGAVFTLVNAALFRGYPLVADPQRLARVTTSRGTIYYPDFLAWRADARQFAGVALTRGSFHTIVTPDGEVETAFAAEVTPDTFAVLGVAPLLGRGFDPADAVPGAPPVVILHHDFWVARYDGDAGVVGTTIRLDGAPATIVGVMPRGFAFPSTEMLWTPLIPTAAALRRETPYARFAYARLAAGATVDGARTELGVLGRRLEREAPATNTGLAPVVQPFEEWFVGPDARQWVQALWWAVGCVLLIACANVASLFVLQAAGRSHELSVRLALGAGRWRLVRVFVFESLLLSAAGGAASWWMAAPAAQLLRNLSAGFATLALEPDRVVLLYQLAVTLLVGLLAGLATATHVLRLAGAGLARSDARTVSGSRREGRLFAALVAVQMAVAVALLSVAAVTVRSLDRVLGAALGVDPAGVITASLYLPPERYPAPEGRTAFYRHLVERLAQTGGVEAVGLGAVAPTESTTRAEVEADDGSGAAVGSIAVSPGYFDVLGAAVVAGRDLRSTDDAAHPPVAVVNRRLADRSWPGKSPIGERVRLRPTVPGGRPGPWHTVVGVVSNIVQDDRTRQSVEPLVYLAYAQSPQPNMFVFVRGRSALTLTSALRHAVAALDPALPVPALWPLATRLARAYALERNSTAVLAVFAAVALALAATGLYATTAHGVRRRAREIGTRRALGATPRDILVVACARALGPSLAGLAAGLVLAVALTRLLAAQLVGVSPVDPLALLAAGALMILAAACGCWLPSRRALAVDPAVVLRAE